MKKFALLFVVMALAMSVLVFAVSAQEDLPVIDETEAADYLGTWYLEKMCFGENCMDISGMGMNSTLTFNIDNTAVLVNEDNTQTISWYMKDGDAHMVEPDENGHLQDFVPAIDENGRLILGEEGNLIYYVREIAPALGTAEIKTDAVIEDFLGEWFLNSLMFENNIIPSSMLGVAGRLVINEDKLEFYFEGEDSEESHAYTLTDGKISVNDKSTDEKGNETEHTFFLEYHKDNTILMQMEDDSDNMYMVFVREENLTQGATFFDMIQSVVEEMGEGTGKTE